ncbi:unnamed protein product [Brachionus calyciflorus]|uniref:Uncharacterized protein n=1 Tax=Brachionus calyciflorus TaxID=104777 RepID=A0A813MJ93_9BILA|nr:unnamed protein product [Brachionus calyciflorus]
MLSVYEDGIEKKRVPTYLQKCFKSNLHSIFNTIYKQLKTEFEMKIDNNSSLNKAFNHNSLSVLNEILQAINSNNSFDDYEKNSFNNFFEILLDHALFFLESQDEIGDGTLRNFFNFLFCRSLPLELAFSRENHILAEKILLLGKDFNVIEENYFNLIINCIKNDNSQLIAGIEYNGIECFELMFLSTTHPKLLSYLFKEDSNDGLIPLNVAIKNNNLEMVKIITNYVKSTGCIKQMLKKQNAAHFAAEYATNNIIELILMFKPYLNYTHFESKTFIEILCKKGNLKMLEKTFEIYTKEELESMSIRNCLFDAIQSHQAAVVEFLLKKHSNKEILDSKFFKDQLIITDKSEIYRKNIILSKLNETKDKTIGKFGHNKIKGEELENKPISIELENNVNVAEENPIKIKKFEKKYKTTENKYNILDWAIKCNEEECAKLIVEYADLNELENILIFAEKNESDEMPLTFWKLISKMPRIAETCLDRFLDLKPEKNEYDLNFTLLDRPCLLKRYPHLKTKISSHNTLGIMIKNDCGYLLKHPMVKIYMNLRWSPKSSLFYNFGLLLNILFVSILTLFLVNFRDKKEANLYLQILVLILSVIFLIIEFGQLFKFRQKYFSFENLIQIISFGTSAASAVPFVFLEVEKRLEIGSIAILFSYFALGLYSKKVHKIGIYSTALMQVTLTIIKFLFTISIYLIGFSVAFYVLFTNSEFDYKLAWIVRIFFLMAGDFSFTELKTGTSKDTRYFIMVLFLIVLAIAVNNMLVSFAIKDTNEILNQAYFINIKTQVEFLEMIESSFKTFRRNSIQFDKIQININEGKEDKVDKYINRILEPNELIIKNALHDKKYLKN